MKTINYSILIIIISFSTVFCQESKNTVVKTNLLYLVSKGFDLGIERKAKAKKNISHHVSFGYIDYLLFRGENDFNKLLTVTYERRKYLFSRSVFNGAYISPYLKYKKKNINIIGSGDGFLNNYDNTSYQSNAFGGGINLGLEFIVFKNFTLETSGGAGALYTISYFGETKPYDFRLDLNMVLGLGYRF